MRASVRRGYGRLIIGRWVHLGDGTRLFAHEGTLRIGDKAVFGSEVTVTCYLDVEIGGSTLVADWVYISDFDHVTTDLKQPIKDQGLVKSPVRVGRDCWLGIRSTVLRGSRIGSGVVVGAHSVVRGEVPDEMIVGGVPAKPLKDRREAYEADADRRAYLEGLARGAEADAERARRGGPDADDASDRAESSDRAEPSDQAESTGRAKPLDRAELSSRAESPSRAEVAAAEGPEGPREAP